MLAQPRTGWKRSGLEGILVGHAASIRTIIPGPILKVLKVTECA